MAYEWRKRGLRVETQVPIAVTWEDVRLELGFRADLIVEAAVVVELKSVDAIAPVHKKQLLTKELRTNNLNDYLGWYGHLACSGRAGRPCHPSAIRSRYFRAMPYLRLADKRVGLLINFNVALLKERISRIVNRLEDEVRSEAQRPRSEGGYDLVSVKPFGVSRRRDSRTRTAAYHRSQIVLACMNSCR